MNDFSNLEELKRRWQAFDNADMSDVDTQKVFALSTASTHRKSIVRTYRTSLIVCCVCVVLIPCSLLKILHVPLLMAYLCAVYFLIMGVLGAIGLDIVSRIDLPGMPTVEILRRVKRFQAYRVWSKVVGITMAVPLVGYMLYVFGNESVELLVSGMGGALAGLAIGLSRDRKIVSHIRSINDELKELSAGEDL